MPSENDETVGSRVWNILEKVEKNFEKNAEGSEMTEELIARISEIGLTQESITEGTVHRKLDKRDDELIEAIEKGKFRGYKGTPEPETVVQGSYLEDAYQAARN